MTKRDRLLPWIIAAGILASAIVSWYLRSTAMATVIGVFISVTPIPSKSQKGAVSAGAIVGAIVGSISEAVVYSPERGVSGILIATAFGVAVGTMWAHFVFLISEAFRRSASDSGRS